MTLAAATLVFGSFSCSPTGGSATPKNEADSAAYALGLIQGSEIAQNIESFNMQSENKIDTKDFIKGLEEGMADSTRFAFYAGGQTGVGIAAQVKQDSLNAKLYMAGLRAAIQGDSASRMMTEEVARDIAQVFQQKRREILAEQRFGENKKKGAEFIEEFKKEEGVQTTESGLAYKVLHRGKGESPKAEDTVKVKYIGTRVDGSEFDKDTDGVEFQLNGVIKGWTEMLQLMKVGDKVKVAIPYDLAYGSSGSYSIEPFSTLIFEIELLAVKKGEAK